MLRKSKSLIGLDIGSHSVKAVEIENRGGHYEITGFGQTGVVDEETRGQAVSNLIRRCGFRTRRAAVAVSGKAVIVRYLSMVRMSDEELEKAIEFEADKYIPFNISDVVLDCMRLDDAPSGLELDSLSEDKMRVLLVAAKKSLVLDVVNQVSTVGLSPQIVDVNAFAIGNAFELTCDASGDPTRSEKVVALIDVGARKTNLNIVRGSTSYFTREVYLGGEDFTSTLSKRLGIPVEEAEKLKRTPGEREGEVEEAMVQILEDLGNEILLSFDYFENQFDSSVEEIYFSGGGSRLPFLERAFERIFSRPVQTWDPTEGLTISPGNFDEEELKENAVQLATAIGLASRVRKFE
jgi:type IV pilus assembly protein PilM